MTQHPSLPLVEGDNLAALARPVPRYTSYPTADRWRDDFGVDEYLAALERGRLSGQPWAFYVHLPFCPQMCAYCGCNVTVSRDEGTKRRYLERVLIELDRIAPHLPLEAEVASVHFGGGTPNAYPPEAIARVLEAIETWAPLGGKAEVSVEVDPRLLDRGQLHELRDVGFNRISMGVQDFDPIVQEAIGRIQPWEQTRDAVGEAQAAGFESINLDLIYGLPHQTLPRFTSSVERVIELDPDRIALFAYAHVPHMRKNQRRIDESALPAPAEKLGLYRRAAELLGAAGYEAIGMDHFARPDDELAIARREGRLRRSFQGYTTLADVELVGLGMSAIGFVGGAFIQNARKMDAYRAAIDDVGLAPARGVELDEEDRARAAVIEELMCNERCAWETIEARGLLSPARFIASIAGLPALEEQGLVEVSGDGIALTDKGRPFVRHVASAFDRYLTEANVRYASGV